MLLVPSKTVPLVLFFYIFHSNISPGIIQIMDNIITNFFLIWNLLVFKYNQNIGLFWKIGFTDDMFIIVTEKMCSYERLLM
ncbi:hypothetical protein COK02_30975 [Bacillus cereus]|nr:hypothetical protein COK02_30975 [Bacillus cereus]